MSGGRTPSDGAERDRGKEWMLAFQKGDEVAFERLMRHYHAGVRKFIGRYLSDADRAEDIAQEAFIRVYRARDRYEPTAKFHTWLFTIVTRLCLNEIRSLRREKKAITVQRRLGPSGGSGDEDDDVVRNVADEHGETPQQALEREELEQVLEQAVGSLPENQRVAILMLRFEDASYTEIAAVLDVSVMAVKSLVNRARETLRRHLRRYGAGRPLPKALLGDAELGGA